MTKEIEFNIGKLLLQQNKKLMVAESCTGGLIGHRVTNVPGSSEYYLGSITAYAYEAKESLLGVNNETLMRYGAVSRETVIEMAYGIRKSLSGHFSMDELLGLSVSGIAGPGGGMPGKPVGLVWFGLSTPEADHAWKFIWDGDRIENKTVSAQQGLQIIHDYLNGIINPESY
ncbi:MAG: CinA family protein [Anaerolineaceae bacterium]|nr:CinA family protein [Anaerolineaceae bacterium]